MHTFADTGTAVPAFLAKLWRLVEDPETNHLIYWSKDGRSFIIQNQAQFARELLPMNYKHNNMASFIRQLNMYGFHKITSIENGGLKFDKDEMEFSHPCFKRDYPYLLEHIKRKIANSKSAPDEKTGYKPEAVNKVLNEVKVMRGRQDSLDSRFSAMKQENEALWREIAVLRQKHMKQQQIVNKLIQFLVTIVQPSRNMSGVKRNFQLMINDAPKSKGRKSSEGETGPTIRELELLEEGAEDEVELPPSASPHVSSPGGASNHMGFDIGEEDSSQLPETNFEGNGNDIFNQQLGNFNEDDIKQTRQNVAGQQSEVIQTPEDPYIVYHIKEVSDNNDINSEIHIDESNILNTPMVKKELARNQMKSRKRKWRGEDETAKGNSVNTSGSQNLTEEGKFQPTQRIKVENEVDPLLFLEVSEDVLDPNLLSSINKAVGAASPIVNEPENERQMYTNKEDFICSEIPTDLFEDTPLLNQIGNSSSNQLELTTANKKVAENSNPNQEKPDTPESMLSGKNKNLTLAKFNSNQIVDEDIMRLSTPSDFNAHLDNVQGDLENLKELLKGDGYAVDSNTLLGTAPANRLVMPSFDGDTLTKLFSDSDLLTYYGLQWPSNDTPNKEGKEQNPSAKGSELMAYQPFCADLSEILCINEDNLLENSNQANIQKTPPSSVLNTPYHEMEESPFKAK